jgi:sRNA-binding carbon storage regulator CsrA
MMNDDPKTLVMTRKPGESILFKVDDKTILELFIVSIKPNEVRLSMRVSDRIKISAIKDLVFPKKKLQ